jgi:hypothetical protein
MHTSTAAALASSNGCLLGDQPNPSTIHKHIDTSMQACAGLPSMTPGPGHLHKPRTDSMDSPNTDGIVPVVMSLNV